jgi:hypothetical protein
VLGPALALAATLVVLLAIEGGVRAMLSKRAAAALPHVGLDAAENARLRWMARSRDSHRTGMAFDVPDPLLGWRPRANVDRARRIDGQTIRVTTDAHGLRAARDVAEARTPGVPRIAVFGCSQTFGGQVDDGDVYTARLARMLPGTEVLNFGVHGYGTDQMLLRWENEGVRFRPDVVVLGFAYYHLSRNATDFRFFAKPRFELQPDGTLALRGVPVPSPDAVRAGPRPEPAPVLDRLVSLRWLWDRELRRRDAAVERADSDAWTLTEALITRFARSAHEHGARFVILNVAEQTREFDAALIALADRLGAQWVDTQEQLDAVRATGMPVRITNDGHWGPHGHAALADALRDGLCAEPGLPACGAVEATVRQ